MQEELEKLFKECINELKNGGISMEEIGEIQVRISNRSKKRYGCCKQEEPDKSTRYRENHTVKYAKYNKHIIEISSWVMQLNVDIIKNTIMHEIIHCMPYCNNHGEEFKQYAKLINNRLGYNITTVGNREEDYKKSNLEFKEQEKYKYKIECKTCGQVFYRQRISKNFTRKYLCGNCKGKFTVTFLQ